MILQFIAYSLSTVLLFILILEVYVKKINRKTKLLQLIPCPPRQPVLGHLLGALKDRESRFRLERKRSLEYFPIFRLDLFHISRVTLLHPDDVEQVLTSMKHITKGQAYDFVSNWLGTGLLTSTGSKWQTRRKILTPAFHFNILLDFLNVFNEETKELVAVLHKQCNQDYIDVVKPITEFTLSSINVTAMGTKIVIGKEYKEAVYKIGELIIYRALRPWLYNNTIYKMTKFGKEEREVLTILHNTAYQVIREREKTFNESDLEEKIDELSYSARKRLAMLDLLLSAKGKDKIDYEGIREEVDTFMFEGHDTTSMALCFALLLIANHRDVQDKIVEEINEILVDNEEPPSYKDLQNMKYLERCIKEFLRLYPSVPLIIRLSGEDFKTKSGYVIPKDTLMNIPIYDVHHNPNVWSDPERFDPDRFLPENCKGRHPFAHIPFSAGPRNCIGQKFAMLEMKAAISGILKEFILEPVHKVEDVVIISDIVLRPNANGIKIKFVPRNKNDYQCNNMIF